MSTKRATKKVKTLDKDAVTMACLQAISEYQWVFKEACLEALDEYFHGGELIKTEAVGKEPLVMTGEPPKSNFTVPVRPSYLANMVKTGLKSPTLQ